MRNPRSALAALIVLLPVCLGCSAVGTYFGNRAGDLADVLTLELTSGPGVDAHAQLTGFLGTAAGWSRQGGVFLHGRHFGIGQRETAGIVLLAATSAVGRHMSSLYGDVPDQGRYALWGLFLPVFLPVDEGIHVGYLPSWPRTADVEAGGSLLFGLHVGVSPGEMLDFVLGWTTLDVAADDRPVTPRRAGPRPKFPPTLMLPRGPWHPWFFPPQLDDGRP